MKKSLIAILLALAMALPMTGCSSSAKSTPTPAPADTSAPADTTPADEGTTAPEGYPDGPISMLVGYTAGGGSDLAMRTFDEFLSSASLSRSATSPAEAPLWPWLSCKTAKPMARPSAW